MELITQDVKTMIKLFKINIIVILFIFTKTIIAADMSGYLLTKAIKDFNDKNYEIAYQSLSNIAPTGNPVAAYLLGQMYLKGLGIDKDHIAAYEMILYSSQKLFKHDQALALESQITLSNMYDKGIGTDPDKSKAYMWAFIAHKTNDEMHLKHIDQLKKSLSSQDVTSAEKKGLKIFKKVIRD